MGGCLIQVSDSHSKKVHFDQQHASQDSYLSVVWMSVQCFTCIVFVHPDWRHWGWERQQLKPEGGSVFHLVWMLKMFCHSGLQQLPLAWTPCPTGVAGHNSSTSKEIVCFYLAMLVHIMADAFRDGQLVDHTKHGSSRPSIHWNFSACKLVVVDETWYAYAQYHTSCNTQTARLTVSRYLAGSPIWCLAHKCHNQPWP